MGGNSSPELGRICHAVLVWSWRNKSPRNPHSPQVVLPKALPEVPTVLNAECCSLVCCPWARTHSAQLVEPGPQVASSEVGQTRVGHQHVCVANTVNDYGLICHIFHMDFSQGEDNRGAGPGVG
jgi:hypothetical protein